MFRIILRLFSETSEFSKSLSGGFFISFVGLRGRFVAPKIYLFVIDF